MGSKGAGGKRFTARYVNKIRAEIEAAYQAADSTLSGSAAADRLAMLADGRVEQIIMSTQNGNKYRIAINLQGTPFVELIE